MIDKLTQVNNRQNLNRYLSNKLHTHTDDLFLLMMDVDHFKQINDNYGHLEGDEALIRVAAALKQACTACRRHPYIARYGGDEFIIVAELSEKEVIELCTSIREKLQALNEAAGAPYPLCLSIGYAKWIEGMSPNRLIDVADYKLYKEKAARPRKTGRTGRTGRAGRTGKSGRAG
jgi:diguanylate cyclase (GGDEF)-like protein